MSGIEVAGLVLGAFPLLLSGLSHYREAAKIGGYWWKILNEYKKVERDVGFHRLMYTRNLHELLLPLMKDAVAVDQLVKDHNDPYWQSDALQCGLKSRLQDSFDLYMGIIGEIEETMQKLRKELGLDEDVIQEKLRVTPTDEKPKQPQSTLHPQKLSRGAAAKSNYDFQWFRTRFSLRAQIREELFQQLADGNQRLRHLLVSSDQMNILRESQTVEKTKLDFISETLLKAAWSKADLLFKALYAAWRCPCQKQHSASLLLEHRSHAGQELHFDVILMYGTKSSPWASRAFNCGPATGCPASSCTASKLAVPYRAASQRKPLSTTSNLSPSPRSTLQNRTKKVSFEGLSDGPPATVPEDQEITSETMGLVPLCERLCNHQVNSEHKSCLGTIAHDQCKYHLHPCKKWTMSPPQTSGSAITLGTILSDQRKYWLSRRDRYGIAFVVTSSLAQLRFTPWIQTQLTKSDIFFFQEAAENADQEPEISYGHPFIRQHFSYDPESSKGREECNFYSLGILLLELCFGMTLESTAARRKFRAAADIDKQTESALDLAAAVQWSHQVSGEAGDYYDKAVKWCLFISPSSTKKTWRRDIIRNVVGPLKSCLDSFVAADNI